MPCGSLNRYSSRLPEKICWHSGQHDSKADQTVMRVAIDGAEQHCATCHDKEKRRDWMTGHAESPRCDVHRHWTGSWWRRVGLTAMSKNENASGRQGEKDDVHRHDVVQDLLVATGECDQDRDGALQSDCEGRNSCAI